MRMRKIYVLAIYLICTVLFFMVVPNTMVNSEEVFKNIYWALFYLVLFYMFIDKLPNYRLIINRYGKLDDFFKRRAFYLLIQCLIFSLMVNIINFMVMVLLARSFSLIGLLYHLYHLFFLFVNYAFISLILDFFVGIEFRFITLLIFVGLFILDALFVGSGPLSYLGLTASYSQYENGSLIFMSIKYLAYIALWIFVYLFFISDRKEII